MLQWPLERAGGRSNSKHTVMRDNILTPSAQGDLSSVRQSQSFRTPTTIIIFKLVTKPNRVEFVFLGRKLAKMAPARAARRQMGRPMGKYDNMEFTLRMAAGNSLA